MRVLFSFGEGLHFYESLPQAWVRILATSPMEHMASPDNFNTEASESKPLNLRGEQREGFNLGANQYKLDCHSVTETLGTRHR